MKKTIEEVKLKNLSWEEMDELLPNKNIIMLCYRGSIAHGMYVPNSDPDSIDDKDIMGIFVNPLEHYLGFGRKDNHEKFIKEWDAVFYEVRKFIHLLMKSNPNVMSMLWVNERSIIFETEVSKMLREKRDIFVSKLAYHSFTGYAYSQLKRMTHHAFEGYMGAKRKNLVKKFGYDTKNAAHLIRLLKMGIEFLNDGVLHVEREDAPYLISIKKGEYPLEYVQEEAKRLFKVAEGAYLKCKFPERPDRDKIEKLTMEIIAEYHGLSI